MIVVIGSTAGFEWSVAFNEFVCLNGIAWISWTGELV